MALEQSLVERSGNVCELCSGTSELQTFEVSQIPGEDAENHIYTCQTCRDQIQDREPMDPNHWRCLNDSMWSPVPAVQVIAWRILNRIKGAGWPSDLLDMMYMEDQTLAWAKAGLEEASERTIPHKDSNGAILASGDTVVLIKDLNVKGANFTAKRGTAVRNISLVHDNPEHIEGRVNGQHIVILTQFVKKN